MANRTNNTTTASMIDTITDSLSRLRSIKPHVHAITNEVAVNYTANALLAAGAIPSVTWNPHEVGDFVKNADALLVNIGTLGPERQRGIERAIECANADKKPWCLDPVFVERSDTRRDFAQQLLACQPWVVRGNRAEIEALNLLSNDQTVAPTSPCIAITGREDLVVTENRRLIIQNGHPLMAEVTATGCALSALIGAFLAVNQNAFEATVAALVVLGVAGECASENATGPGSFQSALLDSLYNLNTATLKARARIQ